MDERKLEDFEKAVLFVAVLTGECRNYPAERQSRILARLCFDGDKTRSEDALLKAQSMGLIGNSEVEPDAQNEDTKGVAPSATL